MNAAKILSIGLLILVHFASAQSLNRARLEQLSNEYHERYVSQKEQAVQKALELGLPVQVIENGHAFEVQRLNVNGVPIYYGTNNINAAKTVSTDKVWDGGSAGLSLSGRDIVIGEWDGGGVLTTHQELLGRVRQMDSPSSIISHATHVAGTMIATGIDTAAHGMAPDARVDAYDYNDNYSEMAAACADQAVSNHSYGLLCGWNDGGTHWYGDSDISDDEDYKFGFYSEDDSKILDEISYNAPFHLIVKSAGNDRNDEPLVGSRHPADYEPDDGYDTLDPLSVAKNVVTIGAIEDIPNGYRAVSDVVMSAFSSWGPTDDGRIKPDLVANGTGVYSCSNGSDDAYITYDGTSMSAPNVTGSLALLEQHYAELNDYNPMRASTLKALVIHTADEAGDADGPDYRFGWGLLNTERAAELITEASTGAVSSAIVVDTLLENQTITYSIRTDGTSPLKITLCWTDAPGHPVEPQVDPPDLMLVNDLDMRLIGTDSTYLPWVLDPNNRTAPATTGDNFRDNVEQIYVAAPPAGDYTIQIAHKDTLYNDRQVFSLIVNDAQFSGSPNAVDKSDQINPERFRLYANYPNPFNPSTTIQFDLDAPAKTTLTVFDLLGRKIETLVDQHLTAGYYAIQWNAGHLPSGIYFYRLRAGNHFEVKRMLLSK